MKTILYIFTLAVFLLASSSSFANQIWGGHYVFTASEFIKMKDTSIQIIDARKNKKYLAGHPENAISLEWTMFSPKKGSERGTLLPFLEISKILEKHGVSSKQPIIIIDDAKKGWGESGRLAWMFHELGHHEVAIINGGYQALKKSGFPITKKIPSISPTVFSIQKTQTWAASIDEVAKAVGSKTAILDSRGWTEYKGLTPYGESRGGHVPGATHLHYRALTDKNGMTLSKEKIIKILKERGISKHSKIIAYCTGGIRSAWIVIVLRELGYDAYNYAGSMWQWSAHDAKKYPLEKSLNPFSN